MYVGYRVDAEASVWFGKQLEGVLPSWQWVQQDGPPGLQVLLFPIPGHIEFGTQGPYVPHPSVVVVKYSTYSPVGARTATGSCENTPKISFSNLNAEVRLSAEATMIRLFRVQASIPQWATISDAYMYNRPSSPFMIDPPQVDVAASLRPAVNGTSLRFNR